MEPGGDRPAPEERSRDANMVEVRGVGHSFGSGDGAKKVLHDIRLDLRAGEIVILTGPSGSGKTTLLTLIGGLRSVQEGGIEVLGRELSGLPPAERVEVRRGIGFIFQAHNLFHSLTATQNVLMALELQRPMSPDRNDRALAILRRLGLEDRAGHKPQALSGGQRQRVAIARALANRPRLVLADEPTAALDAESGRTVIRLLQEMAHKDGSTILLVTHDARILESADRIVNMVDGRIVSDVSVARSVEICEFLTEVPVFAHQTPSSLTEIAEQMKVERFPAGAIVFREGDPGDRFYLIRLGSVDVLRGAEGRALARLGVGQFFGEAALLEEKPRNATIRAAEDIELFSLDKDRFQLALDASKSFRDQIREVLLQRRS